MENLLIPYDAAARIVAARVLVLAPHPDDEVLGCGGALCGHVEDGCDIRVVVVTDGVLGAEDAELRDRREWESRRAAQMLGYPAPDFWRVRDQHLTYGEPLIQRLVEAIADRDLIYAPSLLENHPDHRALAMAAIEAVRRSPAPGRRLAFYEVSAPLRPNLLLDITRHQARKLAAAQVFQTQLAAQRYDEHIAALNSYRTYTLPPSVRAAEAFLIVDAQEVAADVFGVYESEHARQARAGLRLDAGRGPLVSVIVRSTDRPCLYEALSSIALQTYPHIEVLVVDARGEGHQPVAPRCGRFPLRMVGAGAPLSRSRAANAGLETAAGDFLIFLDEDDLFLPHHLAALVDATTKTESLAAYSGVDVVDAAGRRTLLYDEPFDKGRLLARNYLPIHSVLFSRRLVEAGCRFDDALEVYEDWDFWLQVSRRAAFTHVPGVGAVYRAFLGRSGLSQVSDPQEAATRREVIWSKWLPRWSGADIRALTESLTREAEREGEARRRLEADLRQAHDEGRQHAHRAAAIEGSTIWRLSAPLRRLLSGAAA